MRDWSPESLYFTSCAYWESSILHTAMELDLFSVLSDGRMTIADLALRLEADERGVYLLVNALTAMELLSRDGEYIQLVDASAGYLCKSSPAYMGNVILHSKDGVQKFERLTEAVKTGKPSVMLFTEETAEKFEQFIIGMKNIANSQINAIVPNIDLSESRRFLDLGGATGSYAIQFCKANPEMSAVVYDLPIVEKLAKDEIKTSGLEKRVNFVAGDFLRDDLPMDFDVVWISNVIHNFNEETCRMILKKALNSLRPGGLLFVKNYFMDDDFCGPLYPAAFGINMLILSDGGSIYSRKQVTEWLNDLGVSDIEPLDLDLTQSSGIIKAVKQRNDA